MTRPAPLHPHIFDCWLITFTLHYSHHNFFAIFWYIRLLLTSLCIIQILWGYLSASAIFPIISCLQVIHSQFSLRTWHHLHLLHSGCKLEALSSIRFSWTRWCLWIHHVPTCIFVFILHSAFPPRKEVVSSLKTVLASLLRSLVG